MVVKCFLFLLIFSFLVSALGAHHGRTTVQGLSPNASSLLTGIEIPNHSSFNGVSSSSASDCDFSTPEKEIPVTINGKEEGDGFDASKPPVKLHLKHRSSGHKPMAAKESLFNSAASDLSRIQTLHKRVLEKKNRNTIARPGNNDGGRIKAAPVAAKEAPAVVESYAGKLMGTLKSGVSLGSGEYFMDVFLGTPPKHFSLILDTGSDLNWIQCKPCHDCFEQTGPHYDPKHSSSYRNISCHDPRCSLVTSPDPPRPCRAEAQSCPYFYWYGDSSNTTGDFATETFTVNLTTNVDGHKQQHQQVQVENVMFGCGHWNRGLFHGAAGLLGLGRGPLSFASQLRSLYGHSFSYCLVDRNSNSSVSSKLIFGEDKNLLSHPERNFTSLVGGKENPADVFYYLHIKSVIVGGDVLDIPEQTWDLSPDGLGGTIIDSGTTLSYFADPAYSVIKQAFMEKVKGYPLVKDFPMLEPCYNVSGVAAYKQGLPAFGIVFRDGAVWNFPVDNYFIKLEPEEITCLAILGTPRSGLSIIGNYQQQNFHIMYDTKKSRLGFAPTRCADV